MGNVLFRNVRVTDPQSEYNGQKVDVSVVWGTIEKIAMGGSLEAQAGHQVLEGAHLSPGWVDMRVYLTDPGYEWKDRLEDLAVSALAGGFTTFVGMPNTFPVLDNSSLIAALAMRAEMLPITFLPCGALSQGAKGQELAELYDMQKAGAIAFTDGIHPIASTSLLLRGLQYLKPFDGLLMSLPLDRSLAAEAQIGESVVSTTMGLKGIPEVAEAMMVERDLKMLKYFPSRMHMGPVSTAASMEILRRQKKEHPGLSVETSALHLLLDDQILLEFDENAKVFPPLRDKKSVAALRKGIIDGTIDVISSSHQPQSSEEKIHDFPTAEFGALGLETSFAAARTALLGEDIPLDRLVACLSTNPRRILKLPEMVIREGETMDFTHFDPDLEWTVTENDLKSRCKNSPLIGRKLQGKALGIFANGAYIEA